MSKIMIRSRNQKAATLLRHATYENLRDDRGRAKSIAKGKSAAAPITA